MTIHSLPNPTKTHTTAPDASCRHLTSIIDLSTNLLSSESRTEEAFMNLIVAGEPSNELIPPTVSKQPVTAAADTAPRLFPFSKTYQSSFFQRISPSAGRANVVACAASLQAWVGAKVCNWFGICDLARLQQKNQWKIKSSTETATCDHKVEHMRNEANIKADGFWQKAEAFQKDEQAQPKHEIPKYVLDHAPLVHLYSAEEYWPCNPAEHLIHTTPHLNYTPLQATDDHPDLTNLGDLNIWGRHVFLQSNDNVEDHPEWLAGDTNIPKDDTSSSKYGASSRRNGHLRENKRIVGGRSDAPAVLIVVPKENGVVDAFWFFFYSYNRGNAVLNVRFGNHVGDWEHTLVRFQHGKPKAVFLSEHSFGEAYTWEAIEKVDTRPIAFSAIGSHAMYAAAGKHPYVLPGGVLHDTTDRGPLWDPAQNMYSYLYNYQNDALLPSHLNPSAPTSWFYFAGHWGDKSYPLGDRRQYEFLGQYHYVNGPLGPRFKNLDRQEVCQGDGPCVLKKWIGDESTKPKRWMDVREGEEMSDEDARRVWGAEHDSKS